MKKIKVIALFGPAGSGKDYMLNSLFSIPEFSTRFNKIISFTTRPIRENEVEGEDYYFINDSGMAQKLKTGQLLEHSTFNGWTYATGLDALAEDKVNVGVFNIEGVRALLSFADIEVTPVYIEVSAKTRLLRQLQREDNPNIDEIIRRYGTDKKDFMSIDFNYDTINNEVNTFDGITNFINYIKNWDKTH